MTDVSGYFEGESEYLKASDLQGREVRVIISHTAPATFKGQDDSKLAVFFVGKQKGVALNKTNGRRIIDAYGKDDTAWKGKPLIVYPDKTDYQGQLVDCIRVRIPAEQSNEEPIPF